MAGMSATKHLFLNLAIAGIGNKDAHVELAAAQADGLLAGGYAREAELDSDGNAVDPTGVVLYSSEPNPSIVDDPVHNRVPRLVALAEDNGGVLPTAPPASATKADWRAYVTGQLGLDAPEDATRGDLVALSEQAHAEVATLLPQDENTTV